MAHCVDLSSKVWLVLHFSAGRSEDAAVCRRAALSSRHSAVEAERSWRQGTNVWSKVGERTSRGVL